MGSFIRFLTESPSNISFLLDKRDLVDPNKEPVDVSLDNIYNMLTDRISEYPEFKEKLKSIPYIPPILHKDHNAKHYLGDNRIPYWDIAKNQIFLIDKNYSTHFVETIEEKALCENYKKYMTIALNDFEKSGENAPELSKKMASATILTKPEKK